MDEKTLAMLQQIAANQFAEPEPMRVEGPEYAYEFQSQQIEKIQDLNKAIDILQADIEAGSKQEAVKALGLLGLMATLATVTYKGKL